jgi:hypothetical protein
MKSTRNLKSRKALDEIKTIDNNINNLKENKENFEVKILI